MTTTNRSRFIIPENKSDELEIRFNQCLTRFHQLSGEIDKLNNKRELLIVEFKEKQTDQQAGRLTKEEVGNLFLEYDTQFDKITDEIDILDDERHDICTTMEQIKDLLKQLSHKDTNATQSTQTSPKKPTLFARLKRSISFIKKE